MSPDQLHRYYRVCGNHFDTSHIDEGKTLRDDAIPNVLDSPSQAQGKRNTETREEETESEGRKKLKKSDADAAQEDIEPLSEEEKTKEYYKSLFEVLVLLAEPNISPMGPGEMKKDNLQSSNLQALLEYCVNCGDEVLKKRFEEKKEFFSSTELSQLIEVCEKYVRSKLVEEVKQNGCFSLITQELVKISGTFYLPVFVRFMDQSNRQQERFFGFLNFEGEGEVLAEKLLSELTDLWGLNMEQCRGQAHSYTGAHFSKIKTFSAKLLEKYPTTVLTLGSSHALNTSLADGMALSGVQLVMATLRKIESFFSQSQPLQLELEHAISVLYPDKEERVNELKESSRTRWTGQDNAFDVALDLLEALLLCVDSVHDNEEMRWSDKVTHDALEISKALTDFEFVMALVILKNTMILTQAFAKNIQGKEADVHFASTSVKAVLHSLKEVSDNIDVYHEFWNDEAVNLAVALEIPVTLPQAYLRKRASVLQTNKAESYYKNYLSVPVVNHIIKEINDLFSEEHLKYLQCLSLVPVVIEQQKSSKPEDETVQIFKSYIPNAESLSAELHCWWVKWSKKGKGETFPSSLHETLQLADVKFFPNMLTLLRLIGIVPTLALEDSCNVALMRFRMYMKNTPDQCKSKSLALLNINHNVAYDLDTMVEVYMNTYSTREEKGDGESGQGE